MRQLTLDVLSIRLEIPFYPPLPQKKADLDSFAEWLCEREQGLALRPDQVRLKKWDEIYGYELVAQFFGENGLLVRQPDKIFLEIKNMRTPADWELVRKLIVRFYLHMKFPADSKTTFAAHVHGHLPSPEDVDTFFAEHPQPQISSRPALFSYVKIIDWEADVRVHVEKSAAVPSGGIFIGWETQFTNDQDWETFIGTLTTVLENSAHSFDLGVLHTPETK